jgi:hypothetical protein
MKLWNRLIFCILFIATQHVQSFAQSKSLPEVFDDNFKKATLEVKLEVVKDAVQLKVAGMDKLFSSSLRYCVDNYKYERQNATFREMLQISIAQVKERAYKPAVSDLLDLFQLELDTFFRIDILDSLTDIAPGDPTVIKTFNRYLAMQNESYRNAKTFEREVVLACIGDLGKMGDPSSFSPILTAIIVKYSVEVTKAAEDAIAQLSGDLKSKYLNYLLEERFPDKVEALKKSIGERKLATEDKCMIAEYALNVALHTAVVNPEHKPFASDLRNIALGYLAENHWSHAEDAVIENFNLAIKDYDKNIVGKNVVLNAIDALGNMKSHESAKRLVLCLDFINSFIERGKPYDEEIVLHVIASLKQLGDISSQEVLLYTRYLDYSEKVKKNAFEAFQSLK